MRGARSWRVSSTRATPGPYPEAMPSLMSRVARFARSPQGKKVAGQAKDFASKPENRRKIEQLRSRIARKR